KEGADIVVARLDELTDDLNSQSSGAKSKSSENLPSALDSWQEIVSACEGRPLLVCLDYDGTLTPIVEDPDDALLDAKIKDLLAELSSRTAVAIISGRDRNKVEKLVSIPGIFYAGSHGLDIGTPDGIS